MTDTVVSDAIAYPHDEGLPNINDGAEDWGSSGLAMALAQAVDGGSYARSDTELDFPDASHDATNDQVDVNSGIAYLDLSGETVDVQSALGGSTSPSYDTTLPTLPAIMVVLPTTVANLDLQDSTLSSIWLAYATDDAVTNVSAGDVYLRSDDTGSVTAPPHPNVKLGEVNPDDASADVLTNRFPTTSFNGADDTGRQLDYVMELLGEEIQTNTTASISVSVPSAYNNGPLFVEIFIDSSDGSGGNAINHDIQIDGVTNTEYNYISEDSTSFNMTSGASGWRSGTTDAAFGSHQGWYRLMVPNIRPTIYGRAVSRRTSNFAPFEDPTLAKGVMDNFHNINSVELKTSAQVSSAKLSLWAYRTDAKST